MNTGSVYENNIKVDASGNATISGNLTVQGTTTTISTTNSVIADKLIELGNGTSGTPSGDAGVIVERGSSTNAGLIWDESTDTWVACTTSATGASTGDLTITDAALKASVITASTSLTLASGATVTAINDEDAMGSNSATALATQQSIKAYVDSQTSGAGNMDNWILEDDDGTEVTVSNGKEVKFIGSGLTTNFTDVSDGTDADPYDLTFTVDAAQTGITSVVNASLEIGRDADNRIKFGTDNQIIFEVDGGDNVIFKTSGEIEATSLDISGDVDVDGTLEADAITVNGSALASSATTDTTNASNIGSGTLAAARMAASQTAITSVLNTSLAVGRDADNQLKFGTDNEITFRVSGNDGVVMKASGEIEATSLDISGDADIDGTLEADAITVDGTNLLTGGVLTSLGTITQDTVTFTSANASDPLLIIQNTTNDTAAARLRFVKDKGAAGADADGCGEIEFYGDDDAQTSTLFAKIRAEVADASNSAEGGRLMLGVATHDGEFQNGLVIEDGSAEDEIDVFIGNGTDSVTTTTGYCKATSGFLLPEAKSVHIEAPLLATTDSTATGETASMVCSAAIGNVFDLVAVSSSGKVARADADAEASMPVIGMALNTTSSDGDAVTVLLRGMVRHDAWGWTAGNRLFASGDPTTTNGLTATAPSGSGDFVQCVAVALSDDVIYLNPSFTLVEVS